MRFLVDANLLLRVAASLISAGFESIHVADVGLLTAADQAILDYAAANGLVIVFADTDFGELLALARGAVRPSAAHHHLPARLDESTTGGPYGGGARVAARPTAV
jgi:hypothetical protein